MQIRVFDSKAELGRAAAQQAAAAIAEATFARGRARVIAATGASQFEFLEALVARPRVQEVHNLGRLLAENVRHLVDWSRVELFHLDEYVGLPETHPASFRRYLQERLVGRVKPLAFHALAGDAADPTAVCREASDRIREAPVDVAFVGIGENGHLAFNDPPADFESEKPYLVVELDEACRRQQLGEGWFPTLDDVPRRAISMSIRQILKTREILCIVPDARKAQAVRDCLSGPVTPLHPASALQEHSNTTVFLDRESAALLEPRVVS
jgi:glucosamine-6-phosphate deaminase